MQNTRLNTLITVLNNRLTQWLINPWRRISLIVLSLLLGNFLGTAISTIAGQSAVWDIILGGIMTTMIEACNWFVYVSGPKFSPAFWLQILNALKIGIIYSLFVEAFKLGS